MASSSSSPSSPPPVGVAEEEQNDQKMKEKESSPPSPSPASATEKDEVTVYKTKVIQFLGRTTPIVLQNDNGPCPLLAICNVLLLKNNLNLSPDILEVSEQKLLSLVAERLIDSNSNHDNKDAGYLENQQQNISDAIDLLPKLTTGIDVNIKFRRIDDFEFTRECAIFDLLDIPLYHGWIVDPQDFETANAIGSKSYNTIMGELVALETQNEGSAHNKKSEDDYIDFVAATTAALGVPSPCLSRGRSFDESPRSVTDDLKRKGDVEEEAELLRVLKLSEAEVPLSSTHNVLPDRPEMVVSKETETAEKSEPVSALKVDAVDCNQIDLQLVQCMSNDSNTSSILHNDPEACQKVPKESESNSFLKTDLEGSSMQSFEKPEEVKCNNVGQNLLIKNENSPFVTFEQTPSLTIASSVDTLRDHKHIESEPSEDSADKVEKSSNACDALDSSALVESDADLAGSSSGRRHAINEPEALSSSIDGSEPIYEGEECILESGVPTYENNEPIYEGEVVLAEQVDKSSENVCGKVSLDEVTLKQGELIRTFLKNSASQLTVYGLFCLQDGLKERELCVFFRNNHFNTMFKFEGELYILATDQGYINQPDLVWEKLNEVNGDTVYMTANFKEFKMEENQSNTAWDEQNAMATTADYLASMGNSAEENLSFNSDLQLAIALQQQEFEQQQTQRNPQQPAVNSGSRLIVGPQPQVPRSNGKHASSSSKPEPKSSKEKCIVM